MRGGNSARRNESEIWLKALRNKDKMKKRITRPELLPPHARERRGGFTHRLKTLMIFDNAADFAAAEVAALTRSAVAGNG
jgi:hypothetical protein